MKARNLKLIHISVGGIRYPLAIALGYYFGSGSEAGLWLLVGFLVALNVAVDSLYWTIFKRAEK